MKKLIIATILIGCGSDPPVQNPPQATWSKDIAPLFSRHCVSCHKTGGIAPFSLETHQSAELWADAALEAVRNRVMPPWLITDDGSCQTFEESRWLSDEEIDLLAAWVEGGTVRGDDIAAIELENNDALTGDVLDLIPSEPYVPHGDAANGYPEDDYRCFVLDPAQDRDRFITAFEVEAGDPTQVHHVLVYDIDPALVVGGGPTGPITNGMIIESLSADQDQIGYSCFGVAGEGVIPTGLPVAWAPGQRITRYPATTGLVLQRGHLLVMQIHYHLHGGDTADRTKIRLELTDSVEKPGFVFLPDGFLNTAFTPEPASLPPGLSEVPFTWSQPAAEIVTALRDAVGSPNARITLAGSLPHMHSRGKSMKVALRQGEERTCIADVFRWDYDWQRFYFYSDPIELLDDQMLETTCIFDTSRETQPIYPGLGTNDEMCLFGVYLVVEP